MRPQETKLRVPRADVRTSCVRGVAAHRRINLNNEVTKQKRKRQTRTDEGRTEDGTNNHEPNKDFSLQVAGAANRSRTMPTHYCPIDLQIRAA